MAIEDAFACEQPVDRAAQWELDERLDAQWELEMQMDPEANFPGDAVQVNDDDEPFRRSPSPWIAARSHSPSAEISDHRRSTSVEIVNENLARSVRLIDPPHFGPYGSNLPNNLLATREELEAWATAVRAPTATPARPVFGGPSARIRATSARAAAQTFIALLKHILRKNDQQRPDFQAPEGATSYTHKNVKVASFAQIDCDLRV